MRLALKIAFRSLFSRRSRDAYSAIGWIAIVGLTLGVAVQGVAISILEGFEKSFTHSILGFNAHLVVMKDGEISDRAATLKNLEGFQGGGGIRSTTPFLYREGLLAHHSKVKGVVLKGIDPLTFGGVYDVKTRLFSKSSSPEGFQKIFENKGEIPNILLGKDLAEDLGIGPEDPTVSLLMPQGEGKRLANPKQFHRFRVVGTFNSGLYEYDSQFVLMDLSQAQGLFKVPGRITGFEMRVGDLPGAHRLAKEIEKVLGFPYQVISWDELNAEIFQALKIEKKLFFIIMGLIVLVAAANLIGLVLVLIADQSKEVSILRAMGMSSKNLGRVFTLQGMILAIVGIFGGSLLGSGIAYFLEHHAFINLAKEVYLVSKLPVSLSMKNFAIVIGLGLFLSYVATRLASLRVLKMELDL